MDKTYIFSIIASVLAGLMQLSVASVLVLKMKPLQYVGAFFISAVSGGGVSVFLQQYLHWDAFVAGALGAVSGSVPAVMIPLIVTRTLLQKAGIEGKDLTELFGIIKEETK